MEFVFFQELLTPQLLDLEEGEKKTPLHILQRAYLYLSYQNIAAKYYLEYFQRKCLTINIVNFNENKNTCKCF